MKEIKNSVQLLAELQTLLDVRKNFVNGTEINKIIADTTEEFVAAFNTKISDDEKTKSEMPCNCIQKNSFQSVIGRVAKHIEENLSNGKDLAAIVIVPLADLLADV